MNPTASDVHVNTPLTNISVAFIQDASSFVSADVFPNIPVTAKSDIYYSYDRGEFNRDEAEIRAPSTQSAGGGYTVDNTNTYSAKVYAFHKDIDDQVRANADSVLNLDAEATTYVTQKMLIKREKQFATNYFAASKWTYDYDGVAGAPSANEVRQWSDYTNSDPLVDIENGMLSIQQLTGFKANTLVLGQEVWSQLKNHPDIVDRIKYSGGVGNDRPAKVTLAAFAALIEIERVFIMSAIENTAKEGQTASHSFIGGKKALLCHSAPNPGIMTPSAGYTFSWTGYLGATGNGVRMMKFRCEKERSDRIEGEIAFDQKLVSADLGAFWDTVVA